MCNTHLPPPNSLTTTGTIDHVFDILSNHKQPFILVGILAHRWMGCAAGADEGFDLLIRDSQLSTIATELRATGLWALFDPASEVEDYRSNPLKDDHGRELLVKSCNDADVALEYTGTLEVQFNYLRLWSDTTYKMMVDDEDHFIEVPELNPWNVVLVEEEMHPAISRHDGWWYGPAILSNQDHHPKHIFSTVWPRAKGPVITMPLLIPKVIVYLDTLVCQEKNYRISKPGLASVAQWQIGNLVRYLYLDLPHQKHALLFQLGWEAENYMESYLGRYKRKPFYVMSSSNSIEGRPVLVKKEDPESYPESFKNEWRQQGRSWMKP